jgi:hypothetical protein
MESDHIMRPLAPILAVSRVSLMFRCPDVIVADVFSWIILFISPYTGKSPLTKAVNRKPS